MTRLFFLTCFIFFITGLFGQKDDTLLYRAYKSKSLTELQFFFENWALETPSVSNEELERLNDTSKNVYMNFQCFYNPRDIDRIGGSEFGNDIYKNVKYFLIQNKVNYGMMDPENGSGN